MSLITRMKRNWCLVSHAMLALLLAQVVTLAVFYSHLVHQNHIHATSGQAAHEKSRYRPPFLLAPTSY